MCFLSFNFFSVAQVVSQWSRAYLGRRDMLCICRAFQVFSD